MGISLKRFADEMSLLMPRLHRELLKGEGKLNAVSAMSFPQMVILQFLSENKSCRMSSLSDILGVTMSAATGIVDRMVKGGLLKRSRDPKDRRVVNVKITKRGKGVITAIVKARQGKMVKIFRNFSPEEREAYLKFVKKIYGIVMRPR